MTQFAYDAQLREEDGELFHYSDVSWTRKLVRASDDLIRDLKRHGYLHDHDRWDNWYDLFAYFEESDYEVIDDSASATVTLKFTAAATGDLTVPAGTRVRNLDPSGDGNTNGAVIFETDADVTVTTGTTGTVTATAEHPGEVYNVDAAELVYLDDAAPTNYSAVTNDAAASGGKDHQLARATVYRALELINQDLMRNDGDSFEVRRKMNRQSYKDELERLIASGIDIDTDGDGIVSEAEEGLRHGFRRFLRG